MANVTVDAAVYGASLRDTYRSQVWTTSLVGYQFFSNNDASPDLFYKKSTDGGATWGSAVTVKAGTVWAFGIWWDKDTPGITGTVIHIWYVDGVAHDVCYKSLQTATDTLGTEAVVFAGVSSAEFQGLVSGAKAKDGNLVCVYDIDSGTEQGASDSPDGVTWSAIASPHEGTADFFSIFPGNEADTRDMRLIFVDRSANAISLKIYDDSLDSWSETAIGAMTDVVQSSFGVGFSGSVRLSDGILILAYATGRDTAGPVDDLLVWAINGAASIVALTNVITNKDDWYNPTVFIDQNTNDIYIAYNGKADGSETLGTTTNIYYVKSTDDGATWGAEVLYSATGAAYTSCAAAMGGTTSRFIPSFYLASAADLFVNFDNSVAIGAPALSGAGDVEAVAEPEASGESARSGTAAAEAVATPAASGSVPGEEHSGSGDAEAVATVDASGAAVVTAAPAVPGRTIVRFYNPSFVEVDLLDLPYALAWKTSRYQNRVGSFELDIPVDNGRQVSDGVPVHRRLRRGWHVTFQQENNFPLDNELNTNLMTLGVIQDRQYRSQGGATYLTLRGGFRTLHLTDRSTGTGLEYTGQTGDAIGVDLVDGDNIIGPDGGLIAPVLTATPTIRFNDITRYEALRKTAEVSRVAIREDWHDRPAFTRIDNPPDSGITLQKVAFYDPLTHDGFAAEGKGIIADPPTVSYHGDGIINRIIAVGSDTVDTSGDEPTPPLTLGSASVNAPYPVQSAVGPNGQTYYYIEDTDSIARYNVVETSLVRTDVKNPSDDAGTRTAAANVLYAIAAGLLLKHKSEIMVVDIPVANGAQIWALPGDKIRLTYAGEVETADGPVDWIEENRFFMVSERHDSSDPSGVRLVRFVLQAPEVEMTIPDLPGAIILPPQDTDPNPFNPDPDKPGGGPDPAGDFPQSGDCCDDPSTDIEEPGEPVPGEIGNEGPTDPPDPPGEEGLIWDSIGSVWENTVLSPGSNSVVFVIALGASASNPHISAGTDVSVEEIDDDEYQYGVTGGIWGEEIKNLKVRYYLVRATGPSPSWTIGASTTTFAIRITANQALAGVAIDREIDQGNEVLSQPRPYDLTLNASASVSSADNKDAVIGFMYTSSTAAEQGSLSDCQITFDGFENTGFSANTITPRKIGSTAMPTEGSAPHRAGSTGGGNGHLFILVRSFLFRLVEP